MSAAVAAREPAFSPPGRRIRRFPLAANLSTLYRTLPAADRPAAAAGDGFSRVETWWPFATADPDEREIGAFVDSLERAGVELIAMNLYAGDMPNGERGVLSDPHRVEEFERSVTVASAVAARTGCRRFNALYGQLRADSDPQAQRQCATANLRTAADALAATDGMLLLEPLTAGDNGDYPLIHAKDALEVIDRARLPEGSAMLLLDVYHLSNNGDDPIRIVREAAPRIGHVQLADSPGRGEPGSGRLDFARFLDTLAVSPYTGDIALEYFPVGAIGFDWLDDLGEAEGDRR